MREKGVEGGPDAAVARIAARQHGVVSVDQLYDAGLSHEGVRRRVASGRLHRVYRGVYAVGHAGLSNEGRWMAAVLACGKGAALSHRSAAERWGMLKPAGGPVHVTVPRAGGRRKRSGINLHRSPYLTDAATSVRCGIRVTTPERTIADLKRMSTPDEVRRAVREAEFTGLPIGTYGSPEPTRSELERIFRRLCQRHRLPSPAVNVRIGRFTVDFLWRQERLIVETDGYAAHRGRQSFEDDRRRDNELTAMSFEVLRFTYLQVVNDPAAVAKLVRARLNARSPTLYPRYP